MRFDRLDILRYGALTERSLIFRPDARLHIIYGPNEAGKSSALSAISDLLFGFPDRTAYGFLSDPATLRIGARITARNGSELSFRRRKGRKSTLLADSEAEDALPDDALTPFLGTLGRDVFERAFGLDSGSLRAGGETMLKSGGEIGSLLFSAASGLTGLSDLRKQLDAEADTIYAQRRSKDRLFYQVLDSHEEARRSERDNELKSGDWKKLIAEQGELEAELSGILADRQEKKRALDHLRMLQRLDPIIREIDREREQLAEFGELADLPADFETRLSALLDRLEENTAALRRAQAEKDRLDDEIAAVHVNDPLLAASAGIMAGHSGIGAYVNARNDMARVRAEVEDFDQRLTSAARRLGLSSAADLESRQPPDADLARLRALVEEGGNLDRGLHDMRQRLEEQHDALRRTQGGADGKRIVDPRPWSEQLAALQPDLADLQRIEALQVKLNRAGTDLAAAAGRLDPPVVDIRALASAPLPDVAALASHRRVIEDARTVSRDAMTKVAGLEEETRTAEHQLAALEGAGRIVSREDLGASRAVRNDMVEAVRKKPEPAGFDRLSSAIADADRLADAALADAERVTRHAQLTLRRSELERNLETARKTAAEAEIAHSDAMTDYDDTFRAAGLRPAAPDRMIDWRRAVDEIFRQMREVDLLDDELEALRLKDETARPALLSLADAVGLAAVALPTAAIGRGLERRLAEIGQDWIDSRASETKRAMAEDEIIRLEQRERSTLDAIAGWQSRLSAALQLVGLGEDADSVMAQAALEAWRVVPDLLAECDNRRRRVRGMTRDMASFEETVKAQVAAVAPDLSGIPVDVAAGLLHERLLAATAENKHRASLSADLDRIALTLARLTAEENELSAESANVAGLLAKPVDALRPVLEDLRRRHRLDDALRQARARFADHAEGGSEEEIRAALSGFDKVAAGIEIDQLGAEEERLVERMKGLGIAQADNERRRRELETGIGAERAVFQKLAAESEARDLARRWVVLKLAASLLNTSMESYREQQADPVMKRAGELFAGLTGGRFSRLLQLYDERDELELAVERQGGEQVPLGGLSEGTGDQLYLALRLAFLEDYCRRNEPAPLVLDDIFQTFDDERTAAGLRTLAAAGGTHQTLLFTHQLSVIESAEKELGAEVDVLRL